MTESTSGDFGYRHPDGSLVDVQQLLDQNRASMVSSMEQSKPSIIRAMMSRWGEKNQKQQRARRQNSEEGSNVIEVFDFSRKPRVLFMSFNPSSSTIEGCGGAWTFHKATGRIQALKDVVGQDLSEYCSFPTLPAACLGCQSGIKTEERVAWDPETNGLLHVMEIRRTYIDTCLIPRRGILRNKYRDAVNNSTHSSVLGHLTASTDNGLNPTLRESGRVLRPSVYDLIGEASHRPTSSSGDLLPKPDGKWVQSDASCRVGQSHLSSVAHNSSPTANGGGLSSFGSGPCHPWQLGRESNLEAEEGGQRSSFVPPFTAADCSDAGKGTADVASVPGYRDSHLSMESGLRWADHSPRRPPQRGAGGKARPVISQYPWSRRSSGVKRPRISSRRRLANLRNSDYNLLEVDQVPMHVRPGRNSTSLGSSTNSFAAPQEELYCEASSGVFQTGSRGDSQASTIVRWASDDPSDAGNPKSEKAASPAIAMEDEGLSLLSELAIQEEEWRRFCDFPDSTSGCIDCFEDIKPGEKVSWVPSRLGLVHANRSGLGLTAKCPRGRRIDSICDNSPSDVDSPNGQLMTDAQGATEVSDLSSFARVESLHPAAPDAQSWYDYPQVIEEQPKWSTQPTYQPWLGSTEGNLGSCVDATFGEWNPAPQYHSHGEHLQEQPPSGSFMSADLLPLGTLTEAQNQFSVSQYNDGGYGDMGPTYNVGASWYTTSGQPPTTLDPLLVEQSVNVPHFPPDNPGSRLSEPIFTTVGQPYYTYDQEAPPGHSGPPSGWSTRF